MHWKAGVVGLALTVATLTGCTQPRFVHEADLKEFHRRLDLSPEVDERNPELGSRPLIDPVGDPADSLYPEREPRHLTLQEAIAIALERGTVGFQTVRQPGGIPDDLLGPAIVAQSDSVRVLGINPAISGLGVEASLSRYDPVLTSGITWRTIDQPIQGFNSFQNGDQADFTTTLGKLLPTGGLAAVAFNVPYQNLTSPPRNFPLLNPAYTPTLRLFFEQSLLQNF